MQVKKWQAPKLNFWLYHAKNKSTVAFIWDHGNDFESTFHETIKHLYSIIGILSIRLHHSDAYVLLTFWSILFHRKMKQNEEVSYVRLWLSFGNFKIRASGQSLKLWSKKVFFTHAKLLQWFANIHFHWHSFFVIRTFVGKLFCHGKS